MKTSVKVRCLAAAMFPALMALSFGVAAQEETQELQQPQEAEQQEEPQKFYISDKVVLGVYAEVGEGGDRIATIETGEVVTEIERSGPFVRVRLENDREGWIGAGYLQAEAPAVVRLRDQEGRQKSAVQAAEKKAADEIAKLRKQNAEIQTELDALKKQTEAAADSATVAASAELERAQARAEEMEAQLAAIDKEKESRSGGAWMWPVFVLATGAGGFALGYQTLGRRIRNKFGGLKIY